MKKNNPNKIKTKNGVLNSLLIIVFVILTIYALSMFFVLGWGVLTSLKSRYEFDILKNYLGLPMVDKSADYWLNGTNLAPIYGEYNVFMNYQSVLKSFNLNIRPQSYYSSIFGLIEARSPFTASFGDYILNTVLYAGVGSFLQTFFSMTIAYITCKYNYKFCKFINVFFLTMMAVPVVGTSASTLSILRNLGIYDSYASMFLMAGAGCAGLYYFVFFGFYQGLPTTFIEAAEIDGASQLMTYLRIIIPVSMKMFGTIYIIHFVAFWNNYEAIYTYFPSQPTFAYAIWKMTENTQGVGNWDLQNTCTRIAGCMILAIPVLILFIAFRNVLMGSLTVGGNKE